MRNEPGQGYNYERGRSNQMIAAEEAGMITIGRWAKEHRVSARAAVEVMAPSEAHHTGSGRPGRSRLTPVISSSLAPTEEQLAAMRAWDAGQRTSVRGWHVRWLVEYGKHGRKCNVPTLAVFEGDAADAPKKLLPLGVEDFAKAQALAGKRLNAYASRFDDVKI